MKTGQRNDKGFSLVELIVVIAILALMTGLFLLSSGIINVRAGRQCTKQVKHEIEQVRIDTMGKNEVTLRLYLDDIGRVWSEKTIVAPKPGASGTVSYNEIKQIGSKRVTVQVVPAGGSAVDLDEQGVYFKFNRSTGAFTSVTGGQIGGDYIIDEIFIEGGGQVEKLKLKKITGRVEEE